MTSGIATSAELGSALTPQDWENLRSWHQEHGRDHLPWRAVATPWNVLLAEVLLHRTKASAVETLYEEALNKFPSPRAIVQRPADWLKTTRPAGLAWRAELFVLTCGRLVALHQGRVPIGWTALTSLPGIGHYIASTVRCFGFGLPEVIVDTNTIRLASRITGEPLNPTHHRSRKTRQAVARLSENGTAGYAEDNYALLDIAAMVCHTSKPACAQCPLASSCATGGRLLSEYRQQETSNGR